MILHQILIIGSLRICLKPERPVYIRAQEEVAANCRWRRKNSRCTTTDRWCPLARTWCHATLGKMFKHWFFTASYLANKAIKRVYIYDYSRSWTSWTVKIIIISYLAQVTWHFGSALGWLNACTSLMNPADFDICNQNQRRWHLKTDYEK